MNPLHLRNIDGQRDDLCGAFFTVEPTGSMDFSSEKEGVENAANAHVETMLFGIKLCKRLKILKYKISAPSPLSGLPPSPQGTSAKFCGSPLLLKEQAYKFGFMRVSQGELHSFKDTTLNSISENDCEWMTSDLEAKHDLLVKVWSKTVHNCLQDVANYEEAFSKLIIANLSGLTNTNNAADSTVFDKISNVLYGIQKTTTGTLTFMREISGSPVQHVANKLKLSDYWK